MLITLLNQVPTPSGYELPEQRIHLYLVRGTGSGQWAQLVGGSGGGAGGAVGGGRRPLRVDEGGREGPTPTRVAARV
jgi:hypothetical protein